MKFHYSVISYFKAELYLRQPVFTDSAFDRSLKIVKAHDAVYSKT